MGRVGCDGMVERVGCGMVRHQGQLKGSVHYILI